MTKLILSIYLFISYLFFFISCSSMKNNKTNKYFDFNKERTKITIAEFAEVDKIRIPYDSLMKYEFSENDSSYIIGGCKINTNKIFIYNINKKTKKVNRKKINFRFDLKTPFDFGYINKDSIFLVYPPAYRNGSHDSILLLINDKGEIKKSYSFDDAPVYCNNNPQYDNNDEVVFLFSNLYEPFNYINNKIFLNFVSLARVLGDPAYEKLPIAGYIDTRTEKFTKINIDYPDIIYGKTFYSKPEKRLFSVLGNNNNILYAFRYNPKIIEYNYKTAKQQIHEMKSFVYDTIYPALTEKDVPGGFEFDMPYPEYFNLLYDKYRKLYYRFMMSPKNYGNKLSITLFDENFNFLAEGFPPIGFNFFFTKDYIISLGNKNIKASKGKIFLTFYKLKYRDGTNQELIAQIKANKKNEKLINKPVTHYIKKNTDIKDKNYTATFMYYEMCPKTRDFVLGFYQFNKEKFKKNQVYLVLVTQNVSGLKKNLKQYNLLPENNSNIIIDSTYTFASYNGNKRNDLPRIVKVRKRKIVTDTVFSTADKNYDKNFQMFLINSGKEQMKLKDKK